MHMYQKKLYVRISKKRHLIIICRWRWVIDAWFNDGDVKLGEHRCHLLRRLVVIHGVGGRCLLAALSGSLLIGCGGGRNDDGGGVVALFFLLLLTMEALLVSLFGLTLLLAGFQFSGEILQGLVGD